MEPRLLQVVAVIVLWAKSSERRKTVMLLPATCFCFVHIHSRRINACI